MRNQGLSVETELERFLQAESGLFSLAKFSVKKIGDGYAELTFPYSQEVARHGRIVHGGIISFALDNVGGIAVMTNNVGIDQVTLELKIEFSRATKKGTLHSNRSSSPTRTECFRCRSEMRDGDGRLCAKALGTWYMILERRSVTGVECSRNK